MSDNIVLGAEVAEALERGDPVVSLETTVISHGLPYPDNLELAHEVENLIRREGVTPATIGVLGGVPIVGLNPKELELMASSKEIPKLSAGDIAVAVAKKSHGATTVGGTARLAAMAGIKLLATGGIGGVHRGARESWDVSADLITLSHTPVSVVCSGVKSILDIPATLEYLETLGVPVVGFRTHSFPAFYLTNSGIPLNWSIEGEREAARLIASSETLSSEGPGLVIANPLPRQEQLDPTFHDQVLKAGQDELQRRDIHGKTVTPFLLDYFHRETKGDSLRVNKQIIRNNARLAARIATAFTTLQSQESHRSTGASTA